MQSRVLDRCCIETNNCCFYIRVDSDSYSTVDTVDSRSLGVKGRTENHGSQS